MREQFVKKKNLMVKCWQGNHPGDLFFKYLKIIKRVFIYVLMFQNLQGDLPEMYIRLY